MFGRGKSLVIALAVFSAGCVATATTPPPPGEPLAVALSTAASPLWDDPQTTPHPTWGWPTLSWPATGPGVPLWWQSVPAKPLPAHIAGLQLVARTPQGPLGVASGAGIAVFGSLAVVPGFDTDTHVIDISNPEKPVVLSKILGRHRGAATIAYPATGRLVAVFATNSNVESYDITDPRAPRRLPDLATQAGSHKVSVVPGTPIVYNHNSDGQGAGTDIFDLTDPDAPVKVQYFRNGYGCHHGYFWMKPSEAKLRHVCAGVQVTQLWDVTDPRRPTIVVSVPVHHGRTGAPAVAASPVMFSHFAGLSRDGTVLLVGDETGGGLAAACNAQAQTPDALPLQASASGPLGALWFYDVTNERAPKLLGWFNPGAHFAKNPFSFTAGCTAHHGRLVPDPEGRDLIAMAFYGAGTVLVDFTDPTQPRIAAQFADRTNTWESWYVNGWVVTGDLNTGMDVLKFV